MRNVEDNTDVAGRNGFVGSFTQAQDTRRCA